MMLLQVTWSMADAGTRAREINGLLEASSVTGCDQLFIITNEDEETILADGKTINVLPAWKWVLGKHSTLHTDFRCKDNGDL